MDYNWSFNFKMLNICLQELKKRNLFALLNLDPSIDVLVSLTSIWVLKITEWEILFIFEKD